MRPLTLKAILPGLPEQLVDLPGSPLLADFAAQVPFQRHRLAADGQDDFQMGRIESEGEALVIGLRLQIEIEQLAW